MLDREAYVTGNIAGDLVWCDQQLHDVEVIVVGSTAVLVAVVVDEVERGGIRQSFRMRLTQTWIRDDGWVCLSGHAGPLLGG